MSGLGRPGTGTLSVDGQVVATQTMERTIPFTLPWDETFDIGSDTGTPVDDADYQVPFAFTGKIDKLTIALAEANGGGREEAHGGRKGQAGRELSFPAACGERVG
jgi:arylsulfatase